MITLDILKPLAKIINMPLELEAISFAHYMHQFSGKYFATWI